MYRSSWIDIKNSSLYIFIFAFIYTQMIGITAMHLVTRTAWLDQEYVVSAVPNNTTDITEKQNNVSAFL